MVIIEILLTVIFNLLFYCFGLYVGGMKEKNALRSRMQELEEENEKLGKLPMERFVIREEPRDVITVYAKAYLPIGRCVAYAEESGRKMRKLVEYEIGHQVINACKLTIEDDLQNGQKVAVATLDIVMPSEALNVEKVILENLKAMEEMKC